MCCAVLLLLTCMVTVARIHLCVVSFEELSSTHICEESLDQTVRSMQRASVVAP